MDMNQYTIGDVSISSKCVRPVVGKHDGDGTDAFIESAEKEVARSIQERKNRTGSPNFHDFPEITNLANSDFIKSVVGALGAGLLLRFFSKY